MPKIVGIKQLIPVPIAAPLIPIERISIKIQSNNKLANPPKTIAIKPKCALPLAVK